MAAQFQIRNSKSAVPAPLVSFVVPCYNYARYLPDCLKSIFGQEGNFDFEIIAVDDASTDETADVLRSFPDPRLHVITHAANLGHVRTVSEGLRAARGTFIARIDPDDRYRSRFLVSVMEKFEAFPEVGLVYGDVALIDEEGQVTLERSDTQHGGRDRKGNDLVALMERNFICSPTVIARREAWVSALPVPEWLAFHDWYFTLMIARHYEFYYVNEILADYRVHSANHHSKVVANKTEESSVFWLLEQIFNTQESAAELEAAKQQARARIFGAQFLDMAEKYFGSGYYADARRCYFAALRRRPAVILSPGPTRRLMATFLGRGFYESSKSSVKALLGKGHRAKSKGQRA